MVTIIIDSRRSAVLARSPLACQPHVPAINLSSGCVHGCVYCYARGYSQYPGDGVVAVYPDVLDRLKEELPRKRVKPSLICLGTATDLFQPAPEVLDLGHRVLEFLFSRGIAVSFLTKGIIPEETRRLFIANADKVNAQVCVTTTDDSVRRLVDPGAADVEARLGQMAALVKGGVRVQARLDPLIPALTDSTANLSSLFLALSGAGVTRAVGSVLFLRPAIVDSMRRSLPSATLNTILDRYEQSVRLGIHGGPPSVRALSREARAAIFAGVKEAAGAYGISVSTCACKNPDLVDGDCNLSTVASAMARQPAPF